MKKILATFLVGLNLFSFENSESVIDFLKNHIDYSVECAEKGITKLPQKVLKIDGMSSKKKSYFT